MFNPDDLVIDFDPSTLINHVTAKERIVFNNIEDGNLLSETVKGALSKHLAGRRGYLITDYMKILIEPILLSLYAREIKDIIDTYLYPGGIARYGMEITRITAKMGHSALIGGDPNLFNTKEEAYAYIHSLIEINKSPDSFLDPTPEQSGQ